MLRMVSHESLLPRNTCRAFALALFLLSLSHVLRCYLHHGGVPEHGFWKPPPLVPTLVGRIIYRCSTGGCDAAFSTILTVVENCVDSLEGIPLIDVITSSSWAHTIFCSMEDVIHCLGCIQIVITFQCFSPSVSTN